MVEAAAVVAVAEPGDCAAADDDDIDVALGHDADGDVAELTDEFGGDLTGVIR